VTAAAAQQVKALVGSPVSPRRPALTGCRVGRPARRPPSPSAGEGQARLASRA
jgi:hypothetical protein